eukprot:TRINITY_DN2317_c0_g1_i1.p1 TRINITY_DN2317_c0_g1~~TRINITY_DN2317_c0_g1_i1.p1  ORF type:complete len:905 (-),score=156.23 TRINITY_DN2317_c0_g1_i1:1192-3906(-)
MATTASSATTAQTMAAAVCSTSSSDNGGRWQRQGRCGARSFPSDSVQPNSHPRRWEGPSIPTVDSSKKSRRSLLANALPPLFRNGAAFPFSRTKPQTEVSDDGDLSFCEGRNLKEPVSDLEESVEDRNASVLKELIPLHAKLLAEGRSKRESKGLQKWNVISVPGLPLESALRGVDAVASDIARLVLSRPQVGSLPAFYWPFFGRGEPSGQNFQEVEIAEAVLLEEEVDLLELEEMEVEDLVALESLLQPRCVSPRSILSPPPQASASALQSQMYARCAWPRKPFTSNSPLQTPTPETNPNNMFSGPSTSSINTSPSPLPLGARCSWPRVSATNSSTVSPTTPLLTPSPTTTPAEPLLPGDIDSFERMYAAPSAMPTTTSTRDSDEQQRHAGPRCAWPRGTTLATPLAEALGPRCAWPRQLSNPQRSDSTSVSLVNDVEPVPLGAHCKWPRSTGRVPAVTAVTPAVPAAAGPLSESNQSVVVPLGPRCAWPKTSKSSAASPTPAVTAAAAPATVSEVSAWFDVPSQGAARTGGGLATEVPRVIPQPAVMGPRCAWPRTSQKPSADVEMGPRCAWPRQALKADVVRTQEETVASYVEAAKQHQRGPAVLEVKMSGFPSASPLPEQECFGPRCAWPRVARKVAEDVIGGEVPSAVALTMGPRCAWPRTGVQSAVGFKGPVADEVEKSLFSTSQSSARQEEVVLGPRCPWPRKGAVEVKKIVGDNGGIQGEEAEVYGPRCAWPRVVKMGVAGSEDGMSAVKEGLQQDEGRLKKVRNSEKGSEVIMGGRGRRGGLAELLASGVNESEKLGERMRGRMMPMSKKEKVGASWPRRVLGTSVCIGLLNQILLNQGGLALASPFDFMDLSDDCGDGSSNEGFSVSLRPSNPPAPEISIATNGGTAVPTHSRL